MDSHFNDSDRVEIGADAFIRTTGQLWKLIVGGIVLPIPTAVAAFWALRNIGPEPSSSRLAIIAALVASALLIVALLASVRCPACRMRLLGTVTRDPEGLPALTRFLNSRACPACGYHPQT